MKFVKKVPALLIFLSIFLVEFIQANVLVAATILFVPSKDLCSQLVDYKVSDLSHLEIVVLALCITLTPGTIAASINEEKGSIGVHIMNTQNPEKDLRRIDSHLKHYLLKVTR